MFRTVDLVDAFQDRVATCALQLRAYGGRRRFSGRIRTLRVLEDNALVRAELSTPGNGAVLVVDGGGSLRSALAGDLIAGLGVTNGWSGLVLNGAVRDVEALATLDIGVCALGANPMRSAKTGAGERNVEVSFGGVTFAPGAMLYRDEDGILVSAQPLVPPS